MKKIQLGGRKGSTIKGFAIVDNEDYEELNSFCWYLDTHGYAFRNGKKGESQSHFSMHRQITKPEKIYDVDHINRDRLDNRKKNLRICERSLNIHNSNLKKNSKSGAKGVTYYSQGNTWRARMRYKGKDVLCRYVKTKEEAKQLYLEASKKLVKELTLAKEIK